MMPGQQRVGISRKIETGRQGKAEGDIRQPEAPADMGFILRTAASEKTSRELSNDLKVSHQTMEQDPG